MTRNLSEKDYTYDDEISLVDLATTLIRRRYVIYAVFVGTVLLGLLYAFFIRAEVREYATLIQLGEDDGKVLETPSSVIANIESHWYPELRQQYRAANEEKLPFDIRAENPESTSLIKLTSDAEAEHAEDVKNHHQKLLDQVTQRQAELLNQQKEELQERIASLRQHLEELSDMEATGEAQAELIKQRARMMSEIEAAVSRVDKLQPAEVLVVARESTDSKGTSRTLILALAIVLGGMFGIFAAFMAEFVSHVRNAMAESNT